jgi:hypothetical protein
VVTQAPSGQRFCVVRVQRPGFLKTTNRWDQAGVDKSARAVGRDRPRASYSRSSDGETAMRLDLTAGCLTLALAFVMVAADMARAGAFGALPFA